MIEPTHQARVTVRSTIALGVVALAALVMSSGCSCNLKDTPMVILQPTEPGAGRVVGLHEIEPYDEPVDPSKILGYPVDAIPSAIVELVEQARKERADFAERHGAEQVVWGWRGLSLHDWGGRVAVMSLQPSQFKRDGKWVYSDPILMEPSEFAVWIERKDATEPPFWHRTTFQMPTKDANLDGVKHGYALITIGRSWAVDGVFDLNADPAIPIMMPEQITLYAVSFRPDGSWAGLSGDTVYFGATRDGAMRIEQSVSITPPDERTHTEGVWGFPTNADIHLSEDAQRALLHDFRIVARDGTITEAPEPGMAFVTCGTPSRGGIVPARIGFVDPSEANLRRSHRELARIDLNTLEHSVIQLRGRPLGGLVDISPGFGIALMRDRWEYCGIKGAWVRTLHNFNEQGRFSPRRSALTFRWPDSGWYEELTPQPNN